MFDWAVVLKFAVLTALPHVTRTAIFLSRKLEISIRLLIMTLDSYTYEMMYGMCLNYFQKISVFDLKLVCRLKLRVGCVTDT